MPDTTTEAHALSTNLRCLRRRLGLSQEELAQRVGLNRGNIASYEVGSAEPKLSNLLKISHALGVGINDLTEADLSCDLRYRRAYTSYLRLNNEERNTLEDFQSRTEQFADVLEGLCRCQQFMMQRKNVDGVDHEVCQSHFGQLREITGDLLELQRELLDFVRCRATQSDEKPAKKA